MEEIFIQFLPASTKNENIKRGQWGRYFYTVLLVPTQLHGIKTPA